MSHTTTSMCTRRTRRLFVAVGLILVALAAVFAGPSGGRGGAAPAVAATGPCGSMAGQPATIKHVVIIMDENQSYDAIMGGNAAPNIKNYANECGVATKYWAITHPSHSNYIGVVAGNTYVPPGCSNWTCVTKPLDFCGGTTGTNGTQTCPNIFAQLNAAGVSWKVYADSMPANCSQSAADPYSAGHNPAVWFTQGTGSNNISASCNTNDVPLTSATAGLQHDITNNSLPSYSWIVPNKCNDMHNCSGGVNPVTAGDTFAKTWIDKIIATPDYQNGNTIIFLTWDEGVEGGRPFNEDCLSGSGLTDESCHVPLIAISPYIAAGSTPGAFYTHYGLLQATERLMGITTFLGHAGDAGVGDLLAGFGLQVGGGGDTTPPTPPQSLVASATGSTTVHLTWQAATDNVGVTNYRIYRNGTAVQTIGNVTSYDDSGLQPNTTYTYTVTALDAAGNESQPSNGAPVTTNPGGTTIFADGFESGNLSLWNHVTGAVTVENTNVKTGTYAADVAPAGTAAWAWASIAPQTTLTYEVDFKINSKTSSGANLLQFRQGAGTPILTVSLTGTKNRLKLTDAVSATSATASTVSVTTGAWHHLTVQLVIGATGQTTVSLDGTDVPALDQTWNTGTTAVGRISFGDANKGRTFNIAFDNINVHS